MKFVTIHCDAVETLQVDLAMDDAFIAQAIKHRDWLRNEAPEDITEIAIHCPKPRVTEGIDNFRDTLDGDKAGTRDLESWDMRVSRTAGWFSIALKHGSRFNTFGFNWDEFPTDTSVPLVPTSHFCDIAGDEFFDNCDGVPEGWAIGWDGKWETRSPDDESSLFRWPHQALTFAQDQVASVRGDGGPHVLTHDGVVRGRYSTPNLALKDLHRLVGYSWDHAFKYEGWKLEEKFVELTNVRVDPDHEDSIVVDVTAHIPVVDP